MPPGQLPLNDFELAILQQFARRLPELGNVLPTLCVLGREFTGVGSFTTVRSDEVVTAAYDPIGLDLLIEMPGVKNGLDAILFFKNKKLECLEIVSFGNEKWDGTCEGYSFRPAALTPNGLHATKEAST